MTLVWIIVGTLLLLTLLREVLRARAWRRDQPPPEGKQGEIVKKYSSVPIRLTAVVYSPVDGRPMYWRAITDNGKTRVPLDLKGAGYRKVT